eukprot:TRINITY_DN1349_c0_g1_i7.p1 TRINITY_DN1349_c0_g1~~TRINITY_DN1349_c0_g1_i7.p1  ORF type:complete len:159 (-),score=48.90 TRINITY_DN1349_c0_g1_i7:101-577(-)
MKQTTLFLFALVFVFAVGNVSAARKNVTFYDFFAHNWDLSESIRGDVSWFSEQQPFARLSLLKDESKTFLFGNFTTVDGENILKVVPVKIDFANPNAGRFLLEIDQDKRVEIADDEFVGAEAHHKLFDFNFSQFAQNLYMSFGKWTVRFAPLSSSSLS